MSLGTITATAYQVPSAPFTDSATTVMPGSGLRQTITASGLTELGDPSTAGFRTAGPTTYQPAIGKDAPAQDVRGRTPATARPPAAAAIAAR